MGGSPRRRDGHRAPLSSRSQRALGEALAVEEEKAAKFVGDFKDAYPGVKAFMEATVSECRQRGFVETLNGRKRYLSSSCCTYYVCVEPECCFHLVFFCCFFFCNYSRPQVPPSHHELRQPLCPRGRRETGRQHQGAGLLSGGKVFFRHHFLHPSQGSAADLVKTAMAEIDHRILKVRGRSLTALSLYYCYVY